MDSVTEMASVTKYSNNYYHIYIMLDLASMLNLLSTSATGACISFSFPQSPIYGMKSWKDGTYWNNVLNNKPWCHVWTAPISIAS